MRIKPGVAIFRSLNSVQGDRQPVPATNELVDDAHQQLTATDVLVEASECPPMYWVDTAVGTLHRLVGTEVENFLPSVQSATSLAVDMTGGKLYWTERISDRTGKIRRANFNGTNVKLVKNLTSVPHDIVLDTANRKIYLTNSWGKIQRLNFDGSNFQPNLITDLESPEGIAVDAVNGKLYWTEEGSIRGADLNGENIQDVVAGSGTPASIVLGVAPVRPAIPAAPAVLTVLPKATGLLPNYPNPFNPETWIPYQLAKPADVTLHIYAANGTLVRTLALGHQSAGIYQRRSRAVYWDGRNELGEKVASGVYFYTLSAGDFIATRKMLIVK